MIGAIITDNGPEIKATFQELMHRYDIPHIWISAYNSTANGVVEHGHFILRESIIKACEGNISQWPDYVYHAFFTDRVTISKSTGFSPFYLLYGQHPVLPFNLFEQTHMSPKFYPNMSTTDLLALRIKQLYRKHRDIHQASEALIKTQLKSKEEFKQKHLHCLVTDDYTECALVLLHNSQIKKSMNRKIHPRYLGPYQVVRRTKSKSYILWQINEAVFRQGVAAFRLVN